MKNNNTLLLAGAAVVAYFYFKSKPAAVAPTSTPASNLVVSTGAGTSYPGGYTASAAGANNAGYPIHYGNYHPDIKLLQGALGIPQSGNYDAATFAAYHAHRPTLTTGWNFPNQAMLKAIVANLTGKAVSGTVLG